MSIDRGIFSPCPEQVLNLFLSSCSHSRSLLKFDLATVGAAVRQRLCLKAVMADIAKVVVQALFTSIMACLSWK